MAQLYYESLFEITEVKNGLEKLISCIYLCPEAAKSFCENLYPDQKLEWLPWWLTDDCFFAVIKDSDVKFLVVDYMPRTRGAFNGC